MLARVKHEISVKSSIGRTISAALSMQPIGAATFKLNVAIKTISVRAGSAGLGASQRIIEYPWVISQIKKVKRGSLVLDFGCAESLLSHMLISQGFIVMGLDIRDYPFKSKKLIFIKKNVTNTGLPDAILDVVTAVSTIEHVGLKEYTQTLEDDDGDMKAMKELCRVLKPHGLMLLTTPYVANKKLVESLGRIYNRQRLEELIGDFQLITEDYFYPRRVGKALCWVKMSREEIDQQNFVDPGLACLVLKPKFGSK